MRNYANPILRGFYPDPSVCRVGEDFYLAASSFEYFPGVPIFHSRDLVNWRQLGHALTRPSQLPLGDAACSDGIFAPTLRWHDGLFYLITTNVRMAALDRAVNFYVTAADPAGPWSEPVVLDHGWFDPSLFFDDDGSVYYTRREGRTIVQARLTPDRRALAEAPRVIARGLCSNDIEGPHLYKREGLYYLLAAEGGTGPGHLVSLRRGPTPWGPWESCPQTPLLTHRHLTPHAIRYVGHAELFDDGRGGDWMVCLGTRHDPREGFHFHHLGRETFLAPVEWRDGWPVVNGGEPLALAMQADLPTPHAWPVAPARDDFDAPALRPEWCHLRNPAAGAFSLAERPGYLRLRGGPATLDEDAAPSTVLRRLQDFDFTARARLEFSPRAPEEEAGLTVLAAAAFRADLFVRADPGGGLVAGLRRRVMDLRIETARVALPPGPLELAVRGSRKTLAFHVRDAAGQDHELGTAPTRLFSTELVTGWTGVMLGAYATGNGSPSLAPADFDWFEYLPGGCGP